MKNIFLSLFAGVLLFTGCNTDNRHDGTNPPEPQTDRSAPEQDTQNR